MAINFCHQLLHTKVTSDKVSADGHEPWQLVSSSKGFIAERFIRTPVNIVCTFACNVDIHKVIVCGKVGAQKSIGFELFAYNEKRNATKLAGQQYQFNDSYVCQSIGKAISQDKNKTTFCFTNGRYHSREPFVGITPMPSHVISSDDKVESQLRSPYQRNLTSVSYLIVRIFKTVTSCVPCIGWLEVWGQPAASSHAQIIADVFSAYKKIMSPKQESIGPSSIASSNSDCKRQSEISVPDDFIDPITQDVMTLPVLLPSGHTVDQTTIDRHEKEEAQWGRSPSNPYTGVPFSKTNMPQQNTSLKVRIDHFLLKHGSDVSVLNRTLGAKVIGPRNTTVSTLTGDSHLNNSGNYSHNYAVVSVSERNTSSVSGGRTSYAGANFECGPPECSRKGEPPHKRLKTETSSASSSPSSSSRSMAGKDLDSLLEEALSGLPSYTNTKPSGSSTTPVNMVNKTIIPTCVACKTAVNITVLYKLSCEHYICRNCLLKRKANGPQITCDMCSKVSQSCDIIKAHQ